MSSKNNTLNWVLSALFLAIALLLPLLTGQIQGLGNKILPMHIPVLLCGFVCGPIYGGLVGFISPLLRFVIFGMPPLVPTGLSMCFELAAYGIFAGLIYNHLPKNSLSLYISLISSMIIGRIIWGVSNLFLYSLDNTQFAFQAFITGSLINSIPGILIQIVIIPILVIKIETIICSHT